MKGRERQSAGLFAFLALAIPVLTGIAFMAAAGAPWHYSATNALTLLLGFGLIFFVPAPSALVQRIAAALLVALLFLPMLTGPTIMGVTRWIAIGPLAINAGLLALPSLAVLGARAPSALQLPILGGILLAAMLLPDAAIAGAAAAAAAALCLGLRDWRMGAVVLIALPLAILAHGSAVVPPVRFVEGVLAEALAIHWLWFAALTLAAGLSLYLLARRIPSPHATRAALAGAVGGLHGAAILADYPTPLIGYGAGSILGLALAIWLARDETDQISSG